MGPTSAPHAPLIPCHLGPSGTGELSHVSIVKSRDDGSGQWTRLSTGGRVGRFGLFTQGVSADACERARRPVTQPCPAGRLPSFGTTARRPAGQPAWAPQGRRTVNAGQLPATFPATSVTVPATSQAVFRPI